MEVEGARPAGWDNAGYFPLVPVFTKQMKTAQIHNFKVNILPMIWGDSGWFLSGFNFIQLLYLLFIFRKTDAVECCI